MNNLDLFLKKSEEAAFDKKQRNTINKNIGKYEVAVKASSSQFNNYELVKKRANYLRCQVMENLDKYLIEFENNFTGNGGKVIWARDAKEARQEIMNIFKRSHARSTVKSKSSTTREIHLNDILEDHGIETWETDLGDFIVQLADEKPFHPITPAIHKSAKEVSKLFHEKLNVPQTDDAAKLTLAARKFLRDKFLSADIGISGVNFLIADIGGIAITENEGNARLTTTFPKIHIAVAGIDKVIPQMENLATFWPLLAHNGTGQNLTVYNTILSGPRKANETDGPIEMYVVLIDNGRSDLLADFEKRDALNCIRCGACHNACPVFRNIGGSSYGSTYGGPIGAVVTPHYEGMNEFKHLSFASTLCGACTDVCPVKIDLHQLLLLNRQQVVKEKINSKKERFGIGLWKKIMKRRQLMNLGGGKLKSILLKFLVKDTWGKRRKTPEFAPKTFNQMWKEKK